jgi:hypothetical protein
VGVKRRQVVLADVALWALDPLPRRLAFYASYLFIFLFFLDTNNFSMYKWNYVNYKQNMAHVMLFYLHLGGMLAVKLGV